MSKLIFREYIGVKPYSTNLSDFPAHIIKTNISEFHFILGFAIEEYDAQDRGTGVFKETWNTRAFGPEAVRILKGNNPNVKVVISIGGRDPKTPFNPVEETIWVTRAVASLKVIIQKYKDQTGNIIDGIDINYQQVLVTAEDSGKNLRFARCIGQVITQFKNDRSLSINVVSIAPSDANEIHYRNLYWQNQANINWVNYQFYKQPSVVSTLEDFQKLYEKVSKNYAANKVLPGVSTDKQDIEPEANNMMPRENFIAGCRHLLQRSLLPGIFLWNADDSAIPLPNENKPFLLEDILQSLLIN